MKNKKNEHFIIKKDERNGYLFLYALANKRIVAEFFLDLKPEHRRCHIIRARLHYNSSKICERMLREINKNENYEMTIVLYTYEKDLKKTFEQQGFLFYRLSGDREIGYLST